MTAGRAARALTASRRNNRCQCRAGCHCHYATRPMRYFFMMPRAEAEWPVSSNLQGARRIGARCGRDNEDDDANAGGVG